MASAEVVKLNTVITAETRQFQSEMRSAIRTVNRTTKSMKKNTDIMRSSFAGVGKAIVGALAVRSLIRVGRESVRLAAQTEASYRKVESVVRATGKAAGISAVEINQFAAEMQRTSTFGADAINESSAALLTFRTITEDTFFRTIKVASDLSFVLGTDLKTSVLQLGKALEDPATGLTALRRSGVSFTSEQQNLIKSLAATNRLAEAQAIILSTVEKQVGGTAKDAISTFAGASIRLGNAWDEVRKAFVEGWIGSPTSIAFINDLADSFERLSSAMVFGRDAANEVDAMRRLGLATKAAVEARQRLAKLEDLGVNETRLELSRQSVAAAEKRVEQAALVAKEFFGDVTDGWLQIARAADTATASVSKFTDTATVGPNASNLFDAPLPGIVSEGVAQAAAEGANLARELKAEARSAAEVQWIDPEANVDSFELVAAAGLGEVERLRQAAIIAADQQWVNVEENAEAFKALEKEFLRAEFGGSNAAFVVGQSFADAFAQATIAGESFGDAMSAVLERLAAQVLSSGIAGLIGAGIGFFASGGNPAGAAIGFQVGSGIRFHDGGIVGGGSTISPRLASDEVPIIAQRGEMVVSRDQTQDMLGGSESKASRPVVLQINGREFGRLIGDLTRDGRVAVR